MKRYRWPIALMALAVALVLPASAMAAKHTPFEASGTAAITGPYEWWAVPPSEDPAEWRVIHAVDEPVDGVILSSNWEALPPGSFYTTLHDGVIRPRPDGSFEGSLRGRFNLYAPGGTLSGNMSGRVSGRANPGKDYINDSGTWTSTSGTGVFAGVKAGGTWEALLIWDETWQTYVGTITIKGYYI